MKYIWGEMIVSGVFLPYFTDDRQAEKNIQMKDEANILKF